LECLRLEIVDIFYGHLEYVTDIWDILWSFGTCSVHLVHFFRFWYHVPRKLWQPCYVCTRSQLEIGEIVRWWWVSLLMTVFIQMTATTLLRGLVAPVS
jgi:hypothetical protein